MSVVHTRFSSAVRQNPLEFLPIILLQTARVPELFVAAKISLCIVFCDLQWSECSQCGRWCFRLGRQHLLKMVSVTFTVLWVSFGDLTTVVKAMR